MAGKSKALLEQEAVNAELVAEIEALKATPVQTDEDKQTMADLQAENDKLKKSAKHNAESEERLTAKINALEEAEVTIVNGKVVGTDIRVEKAEDWQQRMREEGTPWGRKKGQKTKCSIEELRALITSNWTPSMVMEKHGINAEEFKQLIWKLSLKELRDRPIAFSIERDTISKEG